MSGLSDEELQENIESGKASFNTSEAKAYQKVFDALSKEPVVQVFPELTAKIMLRVEARRKRAERMDMVYMLAGIFGILVMASAALIYFDVNLELNLNLGFLNSINSYVPFIITGGLLIAPIQFLDKKFVRGRYQENI